MVNRKTLIYREGYTWRTGRRGHYRAQQCTDLIVFGVEDHEPETAQPERKRPLIAAVQLVEHGHEITMLLDHAAHDVGVFGVELSVEQNQSAALFPPPPFLCVCPVRQNNQASYA